jgi:beta-lactamase regulating signal transducer with metallopeptidase domain
MTALGWALVHFIWQGTLVAAVLAVALYGLRRRSANARYVACCVGMAVMMLAPAATFAALVWWRSAPVTAGAGGLLPLEAGATAAWHRLAAMLPQLTLLWLVGAGGLQLRALVHWSNAQRLKHRGTHAAPETCRRSLAELRDRLEIRRTVRIFESSLAAVPMLIGWLRPVILVPAGAVTGLSPQQLRAVLAHELAHVRRHDYLVNLIQAVFESLLFYHPAVWWLSHRLRVEREYCCDDVAVRLGGGALAYAQALSYLDAMRGETYQPALASTGGTLMNRIRRLAGLPTVPSSRIRGWVTPAAATLVVVAALSAVGLAAPVDDEQAEARKEIIVAPVVERADIVSVLEAVDAREAALFAVLRDAGLEDRTLVLVLKAMDPDPRVLEAVEAPGGKHRFLMRRLHRFHREIADDLEAGRISHEEARQHLERAETRLRRHLEAARAPHGRRGLPQLHMERLRRHLEGEVEAGRISEQEARQRLERARSARHPRPIAEPDPHRRIGFELVGPRMHRIRAEIHEQLAAGRITKEEAVRRLEQVRQRVHDELAERLAPEHRAVMERIKERMDAVRAEIEEDLAAGRITRQDAMRRLREAKRELHENLGPRMDERRRGHRDRGRPWIRELPEDRELRELHEDHEEHEHQE